MKETELINGAAYDVLDSSGEEWIGMRWDRASRSFVAVWVIVDRSRRQTQHVKRVRIEDTHYAVPSKER